MLEPQDGLLRIKDQMRRIPLDSLQPGFQGGVDTSDLDDGGEFGFCDGARRGWNQYCDCESQRLQRASHPAMAGATKLERPPDLCSTVSGVPSADTSHSDLTEGLVDEDGPAETYRAVEVSEVLRVDPHASMGDALPEVDLE